MKKGQVTVFIIIGVVMVIGFGLLFFIFGRAVPEEQRPDEIIFDEASVRNYMRSCIEAVGDQGLIILGKQGGRIYPDKHVKTTNYRIRRNIVDGEKDLPEVTEMQQDLKRYLDEHLNPDCIRDFRAFTERGWQVDYGTADSNVVVTELSVDFEVSMKVTVRRDSKKIDINQYTTRRNLRLPELLEKAGKIIDSHIDNEGWADANLVKDLGLELTLFPYENNLIYNLKDPDQIIKTKPYEFMFVV